MQKQLILSMSIICIRKHSLFHSLKLLGCKLFKEAYHESMAPELIMGQKVTKATDIYSFGCIIDEIMCEKLCYHDYCLQGISQVIVIILPLVKIQFIRDIRRGLRPTIDSTIPKGPISKQIMRNRGSLFDSRLLQGIQLSSFSRDCV